MAAHTKIADVEQALRDARGAVSVAAEKLGISRRSLYERIKRHPRLQVILDDARQREVDVAELTLARIMRDDTDRKAQLKATIYTLETHGQDRGYGLPKTINIATPQPIKAEVTTLDTSALTLEQKLALRAALREAKDANPPTTPSTAPRAATDAGDGT